MKTIATLILALAAASSIGAHASVVDVTFSGTVDSGTAEPLGTTVSGEFLYDTSRSSFLSFVIDGQSVASGFASSASFSAGNYSAIYQAQVSPVPSGVGVNSTFTLDLEGQNPWSSADPIALLSDASQLGSNLDTVNFPSSFSYYTGNADGTNIQSLHALLSVGSVGAVPEPGSWALMLAGVLGVAAIARRRAAI